MTIGRRLTGLLLLALLLLPGAFTASAQDEAITTSDASQLLAYACTFDSASGRALARGSLFTDEGQRLPTAEATTVVSQAGASAPLTPDLFSAADADPRPPLRLILVIDTTDTMPLAQVSSALISSFLPNLALEDEVALITVDSSASELTQYYVDKNALYNDHLFDLSAGTGDNVINDGILAAVSAMQPNSPVRQVVVVITDSRPQVEQASADEIITRAQASKTQIFPVALHTQSGDPDNQALFAMATATRGYGYAYDGDKRSSEIEAGLNEIFSRLVGTLSAEIAVSVDVSAQTPDETGFIPLDLSITPNTSQIARTDRVSCPPPPVVTSGTPALPPFTIAFANIVEGLNVRDALTVEAAVQPFDQLPPDARFVFLLDDEMSPESQEALFPFDPQQLAPGRHTLRAQMRDGAGNVLASTPTTNLFTQRALVLVTASGSTDNLTGEVVIQAAGLPANMTTIDFRAALANNTTITYPIGSAPVVEGAAALTIPDISAEADRLFPPAEGQAQAGWTLQITAAAPSATAGDPPLGESASPLILNIAPRPVFSLQTLLTGPVLPIVSAVVLLGIDLLLLRQVRKARIRRTIAGADRRDLPAQLMCVTISRGGAGRQTFMLTQKTTMLGRGSGNDIPLEDDANVSRQHGAILWRRGGWYFANRKDKVRTRVNGKQYRGLALVRLENPTDIEIGGYQIIFHATEQRQDLSDLVKTNL